MSRNDDRDYYQHRDDFYRELDRRHQDFRDDAEMERRRRSQDYDQANEAMYDGNTFRALGHLDPALALRYAESAGNAFPSPTSSTAGLRLVQEMHFFESGHDLPAEHERTYATRFPQHGTRYVCTHLTLNNPFQVADYRGEITVYYINPDGSRLGAPRDVLHLRQSQRKGSYTTGWGWQIAGRWPLGDYRIEVWVDNKLVGQSGFTIEAASLADMLNNLTAPSAI